MTGVRALPMMAVLSMLTAGLVSAQDARPIQPPTDSAAALLVEVRGLREELKQAVGVNVRLQLLLARLGLQEGRINLVAGQLATVRQQLAGAQLALAPVVTQMKQLQAVGTRDAENEAINLKPVLEMMQQGERALRDQLSQLESVLAVEQGRRTDFNARIDELESSLPPAAPR